MQSAMEWLATQGIAALAVSLRAHGDSSGAANDFGWGARADVVCAVEFIEQRAPGTRIVILSRSLGAAAAIYAAGELGPRVSAYVLEAPYRDLDSAVRHRLRMYLPPVADEVAFAGMRLWSRALLPIEIEALSPRDRAADIPSGTPIVFLSGTRDEHAPISEVEEVARRAPGEPAVVRFEGAGHTSLDAYDHRRYEAVLATLFARLEADSGRR